MFYDHDDVLYLSLHRWDNGNFYSYSGSPSDLGLGVGLDKNVNITFSSEDDSYAFMTQMLKTLANEKIGLALKGGYVLEPLSASAGACLSASSPTPI
ncbi:hypothetical protein C2G38_2235633 [Gigaspora rosea]|uniref:histone deacetylase n=1 Tax=Gigaspora rosea TaxID=44941 RepID=A0A397TPI9_9GLOM|nr:hypothetical protein C2G38_2235633 [Gigaspora rosea]